MNNIKRDKVYFIGIHRYSHKSGIPAEIIGVEMITPQDLEPRLCYHIEWSDKTEDWVQIDDVTNYKIITFSDILNNNIPSVTE
jgi:hypothetical protein